MNDSRECCPSIFGRKHAVSRQTRARHSLVSFGFRKNHSTSLATSKLYDEILNNSDQGMYTYCIFVNLKKAFDTVDHDLLIQKLKFNYGIRGTALNIIKNYLTNRKQYTKIGSKHSTTENFCGVE